MSALSRFLSDEAAEQYRNATFLSNEAFKDDPEDEPFKSKYKAREIYQEINSKVKDRMSVATESPRDLLILSLCLEYLIGLNYIDTEELAEGEDCLVSCFKKIEEEELHDAVSLHINVLNHLGILWTQRNVLERSMEYLISAEKLYHSYKQNVGNAPKSYKEQFENFEGSEDERAHQRCLDFESLHTHTLYYLAQVYAKQEKNELSGHYCHMTLQRQLQAGDYNPVDWGLNAATLSQYYLNAEKFQEARHCLSCGSLIFESSKKNEELSEEEDEMQRQRDADIERCWIKYALGLLEVSRDKMLKEIQTDDSEGIETCDSACASGAVENDHNSDKKGKNLNAQDSAPDNDGQNEKTFQEFELEITSYEEKVTDKLVRTFDEARKVFLFIVNAIENARKFYTLNGHASDTIEIIQDHSKAYKLLAFFELDTNRQCRMHKRRIDMLSAVLQELNPQYYLLVNRQIMFELAETFSTMVDLKLTLIEMNRTRPSLLVSQKINKLVKQSIEKYQQYIDSLKCDKKLDLPAEFPEGDVRPALIAYFCMGRLYSKYLEPEMSPRLAMMSKSLECYKSVVEYCSAHPSAAELVPTELSICQEMVALMPLKMQRIRDQHDV